MPALRLPLVLQRSFKCHLNQIAPNFWRLPFQVQDELAENSFAAPTIQFLYISDRCLVLAQQIRNWSTFDFSVGSPTDMYTFSNDTFMLQAEHMTRKHEYFTQVIRLLCCYGTIHI